MDDDGSGDIECEGLSVDDDESEGMVVGDECGTGIGKGLGIDYEVNPLAYGQ